MANETRYDVTVDASGVEAGLEKGRRAWVSYADTVAQADERARVAQEALDEARNNGIDVTKRSAAQVNRFIASLQQEALTAGKTRAEILQLKAAQMGVSDAASSYIEQIAKASEGTHSFSLDSASARRELIVLAHELSQGNFKNFGGSLLVLGERTDVLGSVFTKTGAIVGIFAGAVAASIGITVHAAEALAEYGEQIESAARSTGLSTDAIQQWNFAAKTIGVDGKDAVKSLSDLAQAQNKAVGGNKDAAAAFASIGISLSDLKKDSPDQLLPKIADAFQRSADGAGKAAVANELFGESGQALIPLLDKGSSGLDDLGEAAQESGAIIGGDTIQQMAALQDELNLSKAKMDALTTSAKTALLPTIVALTGALSDNAALKPILLDFYSGVAEVVKGAASVLATFVVGAEQMGTALSTAAAIANRVGAADFSGAVAAAKSGYAELTQEGNAYSKFMDRLWSNAAPSGVVGPPASAARRPAIKYSTGNNSGHVDESGLDAQLAAQQAQQKLIEDSLKSHLDHLKSLRDQGLIDDETYIKDVHDQNQAALTQELAIAQQQLDIASGKKNKSAMERYAGEVAQIQQKLTANDQQYTDDAGKLAKKRSNDIKAYADTLQQELQTAQNSANLQVASIGMGDQEAQHYSQLIQLQQDFNQRSDQLNRQYNTGQIDKQKYDAELQYLQSYYAQRVDIAEKAWADESAARADWLNGITAGAQNLADEVANKAQQASKVFGDVVDGMSDAWATFVTTGRLNFGDLAKSVIADIARMQARAAISGLFSAATGALNSLFSSGSASAGLGLLGGSTLGASSGYSSSVTPYSFHLASGGRVAGPGSSTSDSIPAMLSDGEYVLNAAAVNRIGVGNLDMLNSGGTVNHLDRFANGGVVGAASTISGAGSSSGDGLTVNVIGAQSQPEVRTRKGPNGDIVDLIFKEVRGRLATDITRGTGPLTQAAQRSWNLRRNTG